jgi:hypothetical protein
MNERQRGKLMLRTGNRQANSREPSKSLHMLRSSLPKLSSSESGEQMVSFRGRFIVYPGNPVSLLKSIICVALL